MFFIWVLLFYNIVRSIFLSGGSDLRLDEVVLHETLEVEVGELIIVLDLEESRELGIRDDLTAILLILKLVSTDVSVDLLAHLSAGHLGARRLSEKRRELITDAGGLDEARGLTVTRTLALLSRRLLGGLELTSDRLLEGLEITLERGKDAESLLDLSTKLVKLERNRGVDGLDNLIRRWSGGLRHRGGSSGDLNGDLGLLGGLLHNGLGSGGSGLLVSLRCTNHSKLYIILDRLFKWFNR